MISTAFACLFVGMVASTTGALVYGIALGFAYGSFQAIASIVTAIKEREAQRTRAQQHRRARRPGQIAALTHVAHR